MVLFSIKTMITNIHNLLAAATAAAFLLTINVVLPFPTAAAFVPSDLSFQNIGSRARTLIPSSRVILRVGATLPSHFGANATHSYDHVSLSRGSLSSEKPRTLSSLEADIKAKDAKKMSLVRSQRRHFPSMLISAKSSRSTAQRNVPVKSLQQGNVKYLNPIQKIWLFVRAQVPKAWIEYKIDPTKGSNQPAKRVPLLILLFKALDCLLSPPKSTISGSSNSTISSSNSLPKSTYQSQTHHKERSEEDWSEQFLHEAQTHLYSDPVVRAAVGLPLQVTRQNKQNNKMTPSVQAIRVNGKKVHPLEMGFRIQGSRGSGVVIAMATKTDGIVKLTLHLMKDDNNNSNLSQKGRVIPVSILKRSSPIQRLK